MKTLILGLGYVGFHLGVALSDGFEVLGYDVNSAKMAALSSPISLFSDAQGKWNPNLIIPVTDLEKAAKESEFAFLALPTDFSPEKNAFDVERYLSTELSPKEYDLYFVMEIDMEEAEDDEDDSDDWYEDDTDWNGDEPLDYGAVL